MSTPNNMNKNGFALGKQNFKLIAIGLVVIIVGFILMAGGKSNDPKVFNAAMFNTQRIVIAPLVSFAGFLFILYAIMKKPVE
jgi:hypothetical protein